MTNTTTNRPHGEFDLILYFIRRSPNRLELNTAYVNLRAEPLLSQLYLLLHKRFTEVSKCPVAGQGTKWIKFPEVTEFPLKDSFKRFNFLMIFYVSLEM